MPSTGQFHRRGVIATAAAAAAAVGAAGAKEPVREWTVMIYVNGKNNLEPDALDNYHAMAEVGSSPDVNFLVEMGRPSKVRYTSADGNWSGVNRFYVKAGEPPLELHAVQKLGKSVDMGQPKALADFIDWSMREYPARRYMLIIWNHGQGWRLMLQQEARLWPTEAGLDRVADMLATKPSNPQPLGGFRAVSSDDDTGSILYNREIQDVLSSRFGTNKLELLGFDACLMGMMETAYAFEPTVKTLVASEELEPGAGWAYRGWMGPLVANPKMDGIELAAVVVKAYEDNYRDKYLTTLSSLNLQGIRASARELSRLSDGIRAAGAPETAHIVAARAELGSYGDWNSPPLLTSVDLLNLLRRYEARTTSATLKAQSASVRDRMEQHVLKNYASKRSADGGRRDPYGSEGLAIYFPQSRAAFEADGFHRGYLKSNTDRPVDFVRNETWADLLYAALGI